MLETIKNSIISILSHARKKKTKKARIAGKETAKQNIPGASRGCGCVNLIFLASPAKR